MTARQSTDQRTKAVERARDHSPFLRAAMESQPEVLDVFEREGSKAAIQLALSKDAEIVDTRLRRQRYGLALAIALGDLAGELPFEEVTSHLSDFADAAIDQAVRAAIFDLVPGAEPL